jgi:hypothetical protein
MPWREDERYPDACRLRLAVGSRIVKEVRSFKTTTEAHFVAGLLDSQGIQCEVREGALESFGKGEPGQPFFPSVWVLRDEDLAGAVELLDEHPRARAVGWSCPQCQSENEAPFDACWSCGAERP